MTDRARFPARSEFLARLETVKPLRESEMEAYAIVKDRETGEHYLRYSLFHLNLAEGRRDEYDHFLPLESDDVLGIILGGAPYEFPAQWQAPYLRTGNDDRLMWFDPRENHGLERDAAEELAIFDMLERFKREWHEAEDKEALTRRLFEELDARRRETEGSE